MTDRKTGLPLSLHLLAATLLFPASAVSEPQDLMEIYRLAVGQDPILRAAEDRFRGSEEVRRQARALFLPELNLEAETGYNWESTRFGDFGRTSVDYDSWSAGLVATQPLFRMESFSVSRQAEIFMDSASMELGRARQDLVLRTSEAYFDVLLAQDQLETVDAELVAIETELRRAQRALEVGTGTITDVNDAQARHDLVQADRLRAENNLTIARETLRRLIDQRVDALMGLEEDFEAQPPEPVDSEAWARRAERDNLQVRLAEQGLEQAREEIQQERATRYPRVDLVARYGRNYQSEIGAGGARGGTPVDGSLDSEQTTVGLRLTMPLYTGGATSSRIRERQAERDATFSETLDAKRSAALEAESAYLNLVTDLRRIQALEQALHSIRSTEQSTQRGIEVGTRTTLDLLNVQRERFETERQLAEARYNYLLNYLRLQVAVGGGTDETAIQDVNFFLTREPGSRVEAEQEQVGDGDTEGNGDETPQPDPEAG